MSLICTLETYLKFKGRKWCKLNDFRFWKIKKGLNEEISESRLMDRKERKDEDIMSLEDEKWPLWSKKEGKKAWEIRHFENKCRALFGVHYIHTIYFFKAREVRSPTLQTVCKSELKWRSYGHLKTTAPSWRVISKWFRNSTYEFEIHFEMTLISNSSTATLMFHLLYLGNCIYSTYEFEIYFEMTPISNSPTTTLMFRLLYLGNCI